MNFMVSVTVYVQYLQVTEITKEDTENKQTNADKVTYLTFPFAKVIAFRMNETAFSNCS